MFDAFPRLRVAFLESGFTWLPAHLWRMDKEWGIQPLDAPPVASQLLEVVDQLGGEQMLLYTSDYPHLHAGDPEAVLLAHLPRSLQGRIRSENARVLYGL